MTEVYLDNSATTRCLPEVAALMTKVLCEEYGNPSSMHLKGVEAEQYIRYTKNVIASALKVKEKEICFTSGGTESDNLAIIGTALANQRRGRHLITTMIEHPAVMESFVYLESLGFSVTYLSTDPMGRIRLEELEQAVREDTILVSIMHTNNEIGSVQPIAEAGRIIKQKNPYTLFHVDAVQGFTKARIYPKKMGIDLLSVSAHKIHGPKGIGCLYIQEKTKIAPITYGGGQQNGLRSGTENVPGIAGFGKAVEEAYRYLDRDLEYLFRLKERLIFGLKQLDGVGINSMEGTHSAPHIVSMFVRGVRSEVLLHALEDRKIYVSAGSACAARKAVQSRTLKAIGLTKEEWEGTIRLSLSVLNTEEEIDYTIKALYDIIPMLRRYTRH